MIVGMTVLPARFTRVAPAGTRTSAARPTAVKRLPVTTKVALSMGARPSPTMRRAPSKTVTVGACARIAAGAAAIAARTRSFARRMSPPILMISLRGAGPAVRDAERAIVSGAHLEPMTGSFVEIDNSIVGEVPSALGQRLVQLPHVLEAGNLSQVGERVARAALFLAVVQNRHTRLHGKRRRIHDVGAAVMRDEIQVGFAEQVARTEQGVQRLPAQITKIDESKAAKAQMDAGRSWVFDGLGWRGRSGRAIRIRLAAALDRLRDRPCIAADDLHVDALQRKAIAWPGDDVFPERTDRRVGPEHGCRALVVRNDGVVVNERANRQDARQFCHAARVIAMEMSEKQVVDLFEAGSPGSGGDAVRVSAAVAGVTGVDEQRLARRCHDEGRLPAFDVDEIDVERARGAERHEQTCARDRKTGKEARFIFRRHIEPHAVGDLTPAGCGRRTDSIRSERSIRFERSVTATRDAWPERRRTR